MADKVSDRPTVQAQKSLLVYYVGDLSKVMIGRRISAPKFQLRAFCQRCINEFGGRELKGYSR